MNIAKDLVEALRPKRSTEAYDTQAEIVRIEEDTAWVHIPGGVDETPVKLTINASEGQTVQVRVANGSAFLVGNESAPPTDDSIANIANKTAVNAKATAGAAMDSASDANEAAVVANQAAINAKESADEAQSAANEAAGAAQTAQASADEAMDAAQDAGELATDAQGLALNAQDLASTKRRVFLNVYEAPYEVGDIWADGSELYICINPKEEGEDVSADDWQQITQNQILNDRVDTLEADLGENLTQVEESLLQQIGDLNLVIDAQYQNLQEYADNALEAYKQQIYNYYMQFDPDSGLMIGALENPFKTQINNDRLNFLQNDEVIAYISNQQLNIRQAIVNELMFSQSLDASQGFYFSPRDDGSVSVVWKQS